MVQQTICVKQPVRVLARLVDTCRSQTWPRIIVKAGMEAMLTSYLAKQLHHYKPQTISGVCDWKCKRIFWITISINWNYFQVFVRGNGHPDPHPGYWKPQKVAVGPVHPPACHWIWIRWARLYRSLGINTGATSGYKWLCPAPALGHEAQEGPAGGGLRDL